MNDIQIPEGFIMDSKGRLVPEHMVRDTARLEDQLVDKLLDYADGLSAQVARFKGHCFDDIEAYVALLFEKYGATKGGLKGNMTFTSFDGCRQVRVKIAERLAFGPELQVAKRLVDTCIAEWAVGANDYIRALVDGAFQVDKEGKVSLSEMHRLRNIEIDDDRWRQVKAAINDSIRVEGSKAYINFYRRKTSQDRWQPVTVALAAA